MRGWKARSPHAFRIGRVALAVAAVCVSQCAAGGDGEGRTGGPPAAAERHVPVPRSSLGVNLDDVNYYTPQIAFLDLMKQVGAWGLGADGRDPPRDAHGWPTSLPAGSHGTIVNAPHGGRWVALYDGDGELVVSHGGRIVDARPGRLELELNGGETHVRLVRINPADRIRNIRIVPIENEHDYETVLFDPQFLERVRPFGALRFLDWSKINGSTQRRWADRPKPDDSSQGSEKGVALEYTIALCNAVQADCWFNIPHMADDDYVRRYAEMVRDRLDPRLHAYVEYSNEVWGFPHGDWCQQEGERLGMPHEWETRLRYQARRSVQIFRIFERALGRDRLVRVLGGMMWDRNTQIVLDFEDAYLRADAVAVAPYFCGELSGDEHVASIRGLAPAALVGRCVERIDALGPAIRTMRELAASRGLPLIAYEGGQHLATSGAHHRDEPLQRLLDEANRHPSMARAYARYLDTWQREGGELMMLYKLAIGPSIWGRWGLLESLSAPLDAAPKYRAAIEFMRRRPPWWGARARP